MTDRFPVLRRPKPCVGWVVVLLGVTSLLITGCVQTSLTRLGGTSHAPTEPDSVRIYLDENDIPGPYEKLALIQASGATSWTTTDQMFDRVREEAAAVGANGVLVEGVDEPSAGAKVAGAFLGTGTQRTGRMIVIRVRPAPASAADTTAADTTAAWPVRSPRGSNR